MKKELIEFLYEAANIQRWNDHIRPRDFTELDKQAHKMILAYVLGRYEELHQREKIDWVALIEGGLYEFLHRLVLTDLKPPVFYALMSERGRELNKWVLDRLYNIIKDIPANFYENFERYLLDSEYKAAEKRILKAAHYLATNWEFKIIYKMSSDFYGIEYTKAMIDDELEEHYDLLGVQKIALEKKTYNFIDLVGQLRFQQRWAHTPRLPKTSVLGHMLIVAMFVYFLSIKLGACPRRIYNNYFAALFHDLPEVLTRDIISPVKRSVEGLEEVIKEYEKRQINEKLLPLLPPAWHGEFLYLLDNEFTNKIICNEEIRLFEDGDIPKEYNVDRYSPLDGELVRACDQLAAFTEAVLSIEHGVKTRQLEEGRNLIYKAYKDKIIADIDVGKIFRDFNTF